MTTLANTLLATASADPALVAERLEALVVHESPSGDVARLRACREQLAAWLRAAGAEVTVIGGERGEHLVATLGATRAGADPGVLLLAHYDTVWPAGEVERRPFRVRGDDATGPGVFDMKGALVALVVALELIARHRVELPQPLSAVIVADEEISSPEGRHVVADAARHAGAAFGLEPPHPDGALKTGRRGVARLRLEVRGREAHSGLAAAEGVSAVDELVDQLIDLRGALGRTSGLELNVGTINGGTRANVIAGSATAEIGVRIGAADATAAVERWATSVAAKRPGATVRAELLAARPVWTADNAPSLLDHVRAVAAPLGLRLEGRPAGGAGDANFTGAAGIPTIDGLGPRGAGAHALTETVSLSSISRCAALIALLAATPLPSRPRLARR